MPFVQDFRDIGVGFDAVIAELCNAERGWLAILAEDGVRAGHELRLRLVPKDTPIPLPSKRVHIEVEQPYVRGDGWVLPFHWVATALPGLFPTMEAELNVAPLGANEVRITFSGRYRPPLGSVGGMADTALLHRIVERSVRNFLQALDDGLKQRVASRGGAVSSA